MHNSVDNFSFELKYLHQNYSRFYKHRHQGRARKNSIQTLYTHWL